MDRETIEERERRFLLALYEGNGGDPARQTSLYQLGERLGLERSAARQAAETLMGDGSVEIRTLAGAVGLTAAGVERALALGAAPTATAAPEPCLGQEALVSAAARGAIEELLAAVRGCCGSLGLPFDAAGELVADVRSIEAQLASPRPKTAIVRECLRSAAAVLESAGPGRQLAGRIARFILAA
jgi:hypothetical protein